MRRHFRAWIIFGLALAAPRGAFAAGQILIEGLADNQVLQRNESDKASVRIGCDVKGDVADVRYRILSQFLPLAGRDWTPIGDVGKSASPWLIDIADIPLGGPYRIEIMAVNANAEILDLKAIDNVFVGDLWIMAGQSNMEGVGILDGSVKPSGLVQMLDMSDRWRLAEEPLHSRPDSNYPIYWNVGDPNGAKRMTDDEAREYRKRTRGAGLGLPFAKELSERTGVPIGLLPCAYGGTSMDQWNPALKDQGDKSLYGAMMIRVRKAGGKIKGVVWYQGESDANPTASAVYAEKFKAFIAAIRADLALPELPFYLVQIGRFVIAGGSPDDWNRVQEIERVIESEVPRTGVVAAVDVELDDLIHADTRGLELIGRRASILAGIDLFGDRPYYKKLKRGPRFQSAAFEGGARNRVRVAFTGCNGRLVSAGRVSGFSITVGGKVDSVPQPYKMMIDPENPESVLLLFQENLPEGAQLQYGRGLDPYCNLRDEAGMGVLAMGPAGIQ